MKHRIDDIIKKSSKSSDFGLRIFGLRTSDFRTSDFGRPRLLVLEVLYPSVVLYTVPTAVLVASKCTYYCTGTVVLVGTVHVQYYTLPPIVERFRCAWIFFACMRAQRSLSLKNNNI